MSPTGSSCASARPSTRCGTFRPSCSTSPSSTPTRPATPTTTTSCCPRIRPGGLLLVDNTLWGGSVLDENDTSADAVGPSGPSNDRIAADPGRVVLLPIGDGLTVAQRVGE